jgi:hypothetical protein
MPNLPEGVSQRSYPGGSLPRASAKSSVAVRDRLWRPPPAPSPANDHELLSDVTGPLI